MPFILVLELPDTGLSLEITLLKYYKYKIFIISRLNTLAARHS